MGVSAWLGGCGWVYRVSVFGCVLAYCLGECFRCVWVSWLVCGCLGGCSGVWAWVSVLNVCVCVWVCVSVSRCLDGRVGGCGYM